MGIYLFNRDMLVDAADEDRLPRLRQGNLSRRRSARSRVQVHLFDGYWEDIGTIKSFYEANLDLAAPDPPFDLASAEAPIYTRAAVPAAHRGSTGPRPRQPVADGCVIEPGAVIENSVIGSALPHRPRRDDPQLGADGRRRLRKAADEPPDAAGRPAADRHRRGHDDRRGDRRQELPHRRGRHVRIGNRNRRRKQPGDAARDDCRRHRRATRTR